uniref:Uncharacterized protein n=1 Tax=Trichogramma kaykai TaxID=54128 RepID=A0ABD2WD68_9HYME
MSCYLLDVLGFRDNGDKLIVKEMALMPLRCDAEPQTWIFKPPFQKNLLDADVRRLNENTSYIHGMSWESGEIDYECINAILCEHLKDAKTIYTKKPDLIDGPKNSIETSRQPNNLKESEMESSNTSDVTINLQHKGRTSSFFAQPGVLAGTKIIYLHVF